MSTKPPEAFPDMPMSDKSASRLHARRPVPWLLSLNWPATLKTPSPDTFVQREP
jgi:hypothetical protein